MDTKFCYYNNYNIKQPRFYCKTCQRYWTAGGTLRNIAPGSGRRKSKSKAPGRETRSSPSIADPLSTAAAAAVAQSSVFGLPVGGPAAFGNLNTAHLLAATHPAAGLLNGSAAAASAAAFAHHHQQLLASHGGLAGLKLPGAGPWGSGAGLPQDLGSCSSALDQLHGHLGAGASASALAQLASAQPGLDARAMLTAGGQHSLEDVSLRQLAAAQHGGGLAQRDGSGPAAAATAPAAAPVAATQPRGDDGQAPSRSASPAPAPQRQLSSPQQPASQVSQQPSAPRNGSASEDVEGEEVEVYYGRPVRLKPDANGAVTANANLPTANGLTSGAGSLGGLASPLGGAQLAGLNLPPSMASLAAVMGGCPPGGAAAAAAGGGGGTGGMHLLSQQQDCGGAGGLLDGANAHANGLSRLHLQLALQQQMAQQENLSQLQGLLHNSAVTAALHAQHPLLQGLGHGLGQGLGPGLGQSLGQGLAGHHQNGGALAGHAGAAAAMAALDPLHRSMAGVGSWLQGGGGGVPGMLPASVLQAQAAAAAAAAGGNCAAVGGGGGGGWPGAAAPPWSGLWSSYQNGASNSYAGYALQAAAAAYSSNR